MLALTRRIHQSIIIGEAIEVRVVDISLKKVKLQISGPDAEQVDEVTLACGEQVSVGPDMVVAVSDVGGHKAVLCFGVPRHIRIRRKELPASPS